MRYGAMTVVAVAALFLLAFSAMGQTRVGKLGVGITASGQYALGSDKIESGVGPGFGLSLFYSPTEYIGIRSTSTYNQLKWTSASTTNYSSGSVLTFADPKGTDVKTDVMATSLCLSIDMMPDKTINPFLLGGFEMAVFDPKDPYSGVRYKGSASNFDTHLIGGIGVDIFLSEFSSITVQGEYVKTGSPYYFGNERANVINNGGAVSTGNDSYMRVSLQFRYYFFNEGFISKLLEAQRDRLQSDK